MNIYEFGKQNPDILLMFHGACMYWNMYEEAIGILAEHFHVVIPALPGHDPDTDENFTSVEQIDAEIEDWLLAREVHTITCLYGLSMGGGLALRFLADQRISVYQAIIDGGMTPYQLPWILTRFIALRDYLMVQIGRHSKRILAAAFPPEKFTPEGVDYIFQILRHMNAKTVWNVFDSCNNYSLPNPLPNMQTKLEYWYGEHEKKARAWDIVYVKQHYPNIRFREIPGVDHGEYCMMHQKEFAADVIAVACKVK
ncbi:MAG: alpha/beta hydrolase [Ethanoligenens sp.]